ncbi:MAG: 4a-hydroxytetrahydrobiopterin dehydratase [Leptolyngbya sp. SIO3F4]|nr:4a-hydroxytetrahydrobiopterin dehydratase [Leptolyngbya sp. SIO3F4]
MNNVLSLVLIASLGPHKLSDALPRRVQLDSTNAVVGVKNTPPIRLSSLEVKLRMQNLSGWTTDGESLFYSRTFRDFVEAIDFINSLVEPAEQLGHHPDIEINYNRVSLQLTTHDAQGLTELDFQLAMEISQL